MNSSCVLIGNGIECLTASVVLASLGKTVDLYSQHMPMVLAQYAFEHELIALYHMYVAAGRIVMHDFAEFAISTLEIAALETSTSKISTPKILTKATQLYWVFVGDELFADVDIRAWLTVFNRTNDQHVPIVLSGMGSLGLFDELAQLIKRSFVYYVPFVFLVDGRAFVSMMSPNLWLFGEKVADTAHELTIFAPLIENAKTVHVADIPTIEFARMSIMAMLATRVSLMNELARLASTTQVDITHISQIMGLDSRIGGSYLKAGAGFGGQTLPNEMAYLADSFGAAGVDSVILSAVNGLNLDQKELMFRKFWQYFDGFVDGGVVSVWGGGYKAGSGRTANSAVHVLLDMLWSYDIQTVVSAGEANDELARLYAGKARLMISDDPYTGLNKSKALFVLNAERIDIHRLNEYALPIFDLGNVLTRQQIQGLTGAYYGVGRNK